MRTKVWLISGAAAAMIAVLTGLGTAHQGWSGYDSSNVMRLTGTIQESGYEHPHGYIRLAVPEKTWLVVLAPPSRMENRGLPRQALVVGKTATVVGYPHRTEADEMRAENITIEGNRVPRCIEDVDAPYLTRGPLLDSGCLKWPAGDVCNQEASMNANVVYVGIDIDDVRYHGSALHQRKGEVLSFQCRTPLKGLIGPPRQDSCRVF